ncbi:MAG TPA: VWA domain-containing protein [Terriglobia bacterium]|nr:VWA domain-containing protein [Terriglobia bacterium]
MTSSSVAGYCAGWARRSGICGLVVAASLAVASFATLPQNNSSEQEVSSKDVHPSFQLESTRNLVLVHVVVRDGNGAPVSGLSKDDFQIFDRGKLQTITEFSLERPGEAGAAPATTPKVAVQPGAGQEAAGTPAPHLRFLALYFDDLHTPVEGLGQVRDAADRYIAASLTSGDRVALFTASGEHQVDFTDNRAALHEALFELRPQPVGSSGKTCADIVPYQAYLIFMNQNGAPISSEALPDPLAVATQEVLATCLGRSDPGDPGSAATMTQMAQQMALTEAIEKHNSVETEARQTLRGVEAVVRRMTILPGQRSVVVVSSGFLTLTLHYDVDELVDRALRANVTLNSLDARGLYPDPAIPNARTDATEGLPAEVLWQKERFVKQGAALEADGLATLAADTGGVFVENTNDFEAGLRRTAAFPDSYYVLGFTPQNLKFDGAFHALKVKLIAKPALTLQARRGYYAPPNPSDPAAREKEEIKEALFSENQTMELPVEVRTQFFTKSAASAQLDVLSHLDVRQVHFHKQQDRNVDNVTCTTALFDRDGHLVTVLEKVVDLNLRDATLASLLRSGVTLRTRFDVKSGTYMVRTVVRDSATGRMSSLSQTVEIPD